jgi:hypothetical protein
VPLLAPLLIPFFAFAAAIVIVGIAQTHTAAHGSSSSSGFWQFLSSGLLKTLFGQIAKAGRFIISHFAAAQLGLLAKWLMGMGTLTLGWFGVNAAFAEAMVAALERVEHRGDPKARSKAQTANTHALHAGRAASHAEARARTVGHDLARYKARANSRIAHATHAVDVTLPHSIGRVRTREEALSRDQAKLKERTGALEDGALKTWEWIRTHPLTAASGAFAVAVTVALQRIGLGNLRCKNFTNVLKRYGCGFGTLLGRLLPLAILLGIGFDFPAFCSAARIVATGIADAVGGIEGAFDVELPPLPPPGR